MALTPRPPVITIMGHVDHGKTTLLDYIRKTNVTAREAGGITQHIGAYQIDYKGKKLTFIDTPGHAAFNKMRERGAKVTDIVVLVVAANDGVKPQTIESIRHIQASNVSIIVAINKIDIKDVYTDMVKSQLVEHGIAVQGFGGDIDAIELSAKTGQGVDTLLETLALMGELNNYAADPAAPLEAVVIESTKDPQRGPVATVIVQQGTLTTRQDVMTDTTDGRIRSLTNEQGEQLQSVTPGSPAVIVGFRAVPAVGAMVHELNMTYPDKTEAEIAAAADVPAAFGSATQSIGQMLEDKPKLKLVLKADVEGTLEAIIQTLDEESVTLIASGVGQVTEQDVEFADASESVIIAFHTKVPKQVKAVAKRMGVRIKSYDIIYKLIEDLQKQMLKLMEPTIDEVVTGEAEILQIFEMRGEKIAGVRIRSGEIKRNDLLHLKRDDQIVANPVVKSMMHGKEDVPSAKAKGEAGLTFKNKRIDFKVGDVIIAYKVESEDDE